MVARRSPRNLGSWSGTAGVAIIKVDDTASLNRLRAGLQSGSLVQESARSRGLRSPSVNRYYRAFGRSREKSVL